MSSGERDALRDEVEVVIRILRRHVRLTDSLGESAAATRAANVLETRVLAMLSQAEPPPDHEDFEALQRRQKNRRRKAEPAPTGEPFAWAYRSICRSGAKSDWYLDRAAPPFGHYEEVQPLYTEQPVGDAVLRGELQALEDFGQHLGTCAVHKRTPAMIDKREWRKCDCGFEAAFSAGSNQKAEITVRCNGCGWSGPPDDCPGTTSYHSDMRCPKCGTTNLDTSEINREWASRGERYGYGDDNFLVAEQRSDNG